jgi:hypothetical protein
LTDVWQLAEAVSLRPEAFGGMAFHRERGVTLEVDAEAYRFLCTCLVPRPLPSPDHPAGRLVPQLVRLGFLYPAEVDVGREQFAPTGQGQALPLPSGVASRSLRRRRYTWQSQLTATWLVLAATSPASPSVRS